MLNLRQVNRQTADPGMNSHILHQLDVTDNADAEAKAGARDVVVVPVSGMTSFGSLNLDAFDNIADSPTISDTSYGTHTGPIKASSLQGVPDLSYLDMDDLRFSNSDSSSSSSYASSMSYIEQDGEIQEVSGYFFCPLTSY